MQTQVFNAFVEWFALSILVCELEYIIFMGDFLMISTVF